MAPPGKKRSARPREEPERQDEDEEREDLQDQDEDQDDVADAEGEPEPESPLERYVPFLRTAAPPAVLLSALAAGWVFGAATAILVLAGGVLVLVIAFFWSSIRALVGETKLSGADAFVLAVPTAEEEKKRAILRALKDIEYEHSVGKLSDADYHELATRYREEAKALLRAIDEQSKPRRERADAYVRARRGEAPPPEPERPGESEAPPPAASITCPECDASNEPDAKFCKSCGSSFRKPRPAPENDA